MKIPQALKNIFKGKADPYAGMPEPMRELYEAAGGKPLNPMARGETDVAYDAARAGDLETIKWYFDRPVERDASKEAMLEAAASGGQYDVAKFVLDSISFKLTSSFGGSRESSSLKEAEETAQKKGYTNIVSLIQERRTEIAKEIAKEPGIAEITEARLAPLKAAITKLTPPAPGKNF